jgi:hypothetical protein
MFKYIWLALITSLFWSSTQAVESRPTACFSDLKYANLTIIHDKESGDKKEGEEEEEEEPDCD